MPFTPQQVTEALAARQVSTQCPRCSPPEAFDVLPGFEYVRSRRETQATYVGEPR